MKKCLLLSKKKKSCWIINRPIAYLYNESDLIDPVTPNKLLFGRNILYTNTEHFDAKRD